MPKIAEFAALADGRMAVVLEPFPSDEGSITLWTGPEREREINRAVEDAVEDAVAAERARICKILRETSVNATRELLIRGVEEGATSTQGD
jgi:hypothetical protein